MPYYPTVVLNQPLEAVLRRGHPWIFSDAVDHDSSFRPGDAVDVVNRKGDWIGRGLIEPESHVRVRLWTMREDVDLDNALLERRIKAALKRRPFPDGQTTGFRLLNGEGDMVPGLVCDIYGETGVLRPDGLAAERWLKPARKIIERLVPVRHWVLRRSQIYRGNNPRAMWWESAPAPGVVSFLEHGMQFTCDPIEGQKTGFFLDQRANRQRVAAMAAGRRVLNLFGYTGGFSLAAALAGASRTTTVDLAQPAVDTARRHFSLNGLAPEAHEFVAADVFDYLGQFGPGRAPFELAICDPPSFAHKRQDLPQASRAYLRLFAMLLKAMPTNSTVALASCSSHIDRTLFLELVANAAQEADCRLVLHGVWGADVDHPFLPGFVEGDYLQFALGSVVRD